MYLGLYTDSVSKMTFDEVLGYAVDNDLTGLEIAIGGGQSAAPHTNVELLLGDPAALRTFADKINDAGLHVSAINCSAWPFHPRDGDRQIEVVRNGIRLASALGVETVVTMSGTPGDGADATVPNWTFYPWPNDTVQLRERQWAQLIPAWQELGAFASDQGVNRLALELHPMHVVFNVPTLLRLRDAVGPVIGANVDPSHLFWQRGNAAAAVRALGDAVYHVHAKDIEFNEDVVAVAGVLDPTSFADLDQRPWVFTTVGQGHDVTVWSDFVQALHDVGYSGVLSIENEDPRRPDAQGVTLAADFLRSILTTSESAA